MTRRPLVLESDIDHARFWRRVTEECLAEAHRERAPETETAALEQARDRIDLFLDVHVRV